MCKSINCSYLYKNKFQKKNITGITMLVTNVVQKQSGSNKCLANSTGTMVVVSFLCSWRHYLRKILLTGHTII